jgi:hypothetical protein
MIWQFGELGYDFSIDENGRVGRKPIRWDYYNNTNRKRLYDVFSSLIDIKKNELAFESDDFTLNTGSFLKRIEINHSDMDVRVIGNFDVEEGEIDPNFSQTGSWYDYFSGQEISVSDVNAKISLAPGEYHIYTTKQLTTPDVASAPIASNVSISGTFREDEILTASYTYSDVNNDLEGTSVYQWYRAEDANGTNEVAISGASDLTYTLVRADRANFVRFSVTPVAQTGELLTGNTVYSAYSDEIAYSTGIDDVLAKELKLYPNPVKDILYLSNMNQVSNIHIYTIHGMAIRSIASPDSSEEINLSNLASGTYLMVFEMEDNSKLTRKIIKQ